MFERCVKMPDGTLTYHHEVIDLTHHRGGPTYVTVMSDDFINSVEHQLDMALSFEAAEEWVKSQPEYAEYSDSAQETLDEVLAILTDEQAATVPDAFHSWKAGAEYAAGDRVKHGTGLYKCLIAHTSVEGQSPDVAVSLWARINNPDPEVIPVWVQPDSTNPYMKGDRVHYPDADGPVYESIQDYNVFAPDVAGWILVGGGE